MHVYVRGMALLDEFVHGRAGCDRETVSTAFLFFFIYRYDLEIIDLAAGLHKSEIQNALISLPRSMLFLNSFTRMSLVLQSLNVTIGARPRPIRVSSAWNG
jgi:hypothetical protein